MFVFSNKYFQKLFFSLGLIISVNASSEVVPENPSALGRSIPAYFKITSFDIEKWREFTVTFVGDSLAENIKENLDSICLTPIESNREDIFASSFIKQKIRDTYCESFKGDRPIAPPPHAVDGKGMYESILTILRETIGDVEGFKGAVEAYVLSAEKVISAYNQRLAIAGGNSDLLKHFLGKIFFSKSAYSDNTLRAMRMYLLAYHLVAGDDYLFAGEIKTDHTAADSLTRYFELNGETDTLVIGCGHSLIADVPETPEYFADEFLKAYTGKKFVHSCQHCLSEHIGHVTVALHEGGALDYDGCAHADITADAITATFWSALVALKDSGRSPIRHIIDHCYVTSVPSHMIQSALDVGGIFTSYTDYTGKIEEYGFSLQGVHTVGERKEYNYLKDR